MSFTPPTPLPLTSLATDFRREKALPFLASLPAASVDLVLTDPPYLISRESGFAHVVNGEKRLGISTHFGAWDTEAAFDMRDLANAVREMARVLRPGGTAIVFFDLCDNCHSYIKTIDVRGFETADACLEDLATQHLDLIATQKGFSRLVLNFWCD